MNKIFGTMKNQLAKRWINNQLIGIDILIRDDDTAVILNCNSFEEHGVKRHFCIPTCDTTIESLEKYDDDIWSECQAFVELTDDSSEKTYIAGEGAMGNEGFIACLDDQKIPIWALFFVNSNPFYELVLSNEELHAISSHDLKFSIDLNSPEKIKITHFEREN